ncbi:Polycystic Kidney Disease Protein 1-Like 1 [Manis pentadactyla]|nr:Polycystic Kidney Disease Protein 1-Like 1 [Manis pentadactyla]
MSQCSVFLEEMSGFLSFLPRTKVKDAKRTSLILQTNISKWPITHFPNNRCSSHVINDPPLVVVDGKNSCTVNWNKLEVKLK